MTTELTHVVEKTKRYYSALDAVRKAGKLTPGLMDVAADAMVDWVMGQIAWKNHPWEGELRRLDLWPWGETEGEVN